MTPVSRNSKFTNNFNDERFQVDILVGADAVYHFLGAIDNRFKEPFIQHSKFGAIVSGPLPEPISETISESIRFKPISQNPTMVLRQTTISCLIQHFLLKIWLTMLNYLFSLKEFFKINP